MKDIVYTRKYTDRKGQERKEYVTVGYLFEKDGKTHILMKPWINVSALQNEKGEVWLAVYDHKTKDAKEQQEPQQKPIGTGAQTVSVVKEAVQQSAPQTTQEEPEDVPF